MNKKSKKQEHGIIKRVKKITGYSDSLVRKAISGERKNKIINQCITLINMNDKYSDEIIKEALENLKLLES